MRLSRKSILSALTTLSLTLIGLQFDFASLKQKWEENTAMDENAGANFCAPYRYAKFYWGHARLTPFHCADEARESQITVLVKLFAQTSVASSTCVFGIPKLISSSFLTSSLISINQVCVKGNHRERSMGR